MCSEDWSWLDAIAGKLDDDFVQAVNEQPNQQERPRSTNYFGDPLSAGRERRHRPDRTDCRNSFFAYSAALSASGARATRLGSGMCRKNAQTNAEITPNSASPYNPPA